MYGFKRKKWYGLRRADGNILLVLPSYDPISKEEFYGHDVPINEEPGDVVVELKLVVKKTIL